MRDRACRLMPAFLLRSLTSLIRPLSFAPSSLHSLSSPPFHLALSSIHPLSTPFFTRCTTIPPHDFFPPLSSPSSFPSRSFSFPTFRSHLPLGIHWWNKEASSDPPESSRRADQPSKRMRGCLLQCAVLSAQRWNEGTELERNQPLNKC